MLRVSTNATSLDQNLNKLIDEKSLPLFDNHLEKYRYMMRTLHTNPDLFSIYLPVVENATVYEDKLHLAWQSLFVRLFHPQWTLEAKFEHYETKRDQKHFMRLNTLSFLWHKENPTEATFGPKTVKPGEIVTFDGTFWRHWTVMEFLDDLWLCCPRPIDYKGLDWKRDQENIQEFAFEKALNSIANTIRYWYKVNKEWPMCVDCGAIVPLPLNEKSQCTMCSLLWP